MPDRDWSAEFLRRREIYDAFRVALCDRLGASINREAIALSQIESRTKTVTSFIEKVTSKGKYADPLDEMTDLVGLRVIVYYPDDVRAVGTLIEREFDIDWANSSRRGEDDPPDRFGYRSDHYIVRTPADERFAGLSAEIQVRTVMQHAWAAVDHRIRYKADDLPRDLSRRLFRSTRSSRSRTSSSRDSSTPASTAAPSMRTRASTATSGSPSTSSHSGRWSTVTTSAGAGSGGL